MRLAWACLIGSFLPAAPLLLAQNGKLDLPDRIEAGNAFSISTTGSGKAGLYIVGVGQALKRDIDLGQTTQIPAGTLYNAGHYVVVVVKDSSPALSGSFDVVPSAKPADVTFL